MRRSPGLISQYESGTTHPTRTNAIMLDRLLGAGGEIIAACGYSDEVVPLNGLAARVTEMIELVGVLRDEVAELRRQVRAIQGGPPSV